LPIHKNSYSKSDRLKSKKSIEDVFKNGKSFYEDPIRLVFKISTNAAAELKAGITVPKKKVKLATKRNLVKRRIKEVYRKNNSILKELVHNNELTCHLMLYYQSNEILLYKDLSPKILLLLQRLQKHIEAKVI